MDQRSIGLYLSRILSGFLIFIHKGKKYKLIYPDISVKYEAEIFAHQEYLNNKFNDWIKDEEIIDALISIGLWNYHGDSHLKSLEKQIEDIKIDLYKNFLNATKLKQLRRSLSSTNKLYHKLYDTRHSLDHLTIEGYSQLLRNHYILINSIYDENNNRVFKSPESTDYVELTQISDTISDFHIDMSTYREIARNEMWKNYWSANNNNLFDKSTINWTDEQKTLVIMTKMYDSAYSHQECPPDTVIEDDDLFDGWMLHQKRENDKNKNKSRTEKLLVGKNLDKANEVFVMASSNEEAQNIYDLNDNTSRNIIRERNQVISSIGTVDGNQLPDTLRQMNVQVNEQFKNNFRK